MAYNAKLGYDPNIDYSLAIKHSTDDAEIKRLQQERQNKINAQYGGADPYKNWDKTSNWSPQTATAAGNKVENTRQYGSDILPEQAQEPGMPLHEQAPKLPNLALEYDSFEDFLVGSGYGNYSEQTQSAIKAAVEKAVNGYDQQIRSINDKTAELARQAYVSMMQGEKNLDQQLAANGYAGGMADSQRIALQANYETSLNELEKQRADTVRELELAIKNAKLAGDIQTAQELAGYLQQIQSKWINYIQNQQTLDNENYWKQQELDAENQNRARKWALTLIEGGSMPDNATLTAAGMTQQEAQMLLGAAGRTVQNTITNNAGHLTGYDNGSLTADQVKQLQKYYGVTTDGMWGNRSSNAADGLTADQAWAAYQQALGESTASGEYTIANRSGDGWVHVPGMGRFSYTELEQLVDSGRVIETVDPTTMKIKYRRA